MRQTFSALGEEAANLLIRRISGDDAAIVNLALEMRLIPRGSLKRLRDLDQNHSAADSHAPYTGLTGMQACSTIIKRLSQAGRLIESQAQKTQTRPDFF